MFTPHYCCTHQAQPVTEENVKKVVTAAGSQVEEAQVKALVAALSEVNIDEALKVSQRNGGTRTSAAAPAEAKKEDKKPAEEEKKKEEESPSRTRALFG